MDKFSSIDSFLSGDNDFSSFVNDEKFDSPSDVTSPPRSELSPESQQLMNDFYGSHNQSTSGSFTSPVSDMPTPSISLSPPGTTSEHNLPIGTTAATVGHPTLGVSSPPSLFVPVTSSYRERRGSMHSVYSDASVGVVPSHISTPYLSANSSPYLNATLDDGNLAASGDLSSLEEMTSNFNLVDGFTNADQLSAFANRSSAVPSIQPEDSRSDYHNDNMSFFQDISNTNTTATTPEISIDFIEADTHHPSGSFYQNSGGYENFPGSVTSPTGSVVSGQSSADASDSGMFLSPSNLMVAPQTTRNRSLSDPDHRGRELAVPQVYVSDASGNSLSPVPSGGSSSTNLMPPSPQGSSSYLNPEDIPRRSRSTSSARSRSRSRSASSRDYILELAAPPQPNKRVQKHPSTFACHLCEKKFTRMYNLRSHLRTHTQEKPFVCTVCGKPFARQHDRKRHEALHSGEKKFECKGVLSDGVTEWGCGRKFARNDALARHFRTEGGRECLRPLYEEAAREQAVSSSQFGSSLTVAANASMPVGTGDFDSSAPFAFPPALLQQFPGLMSHQQPDSNDGEQLEFVNAAI